MHCRRVLFFFALAFTALLPFRSPAPLYYTPGEGWYYEPYGQSADWQRPRAKEQLEVAELLFKEKDYSGALRSAHRVVRLWPLSDYAPEAQYLIARCLEARREDQAAFHA